ncbi:hypothetical protein M758_2G022600 [Ceratodon purpureus]|nr:hypothetical protein M758_2G022600 [Ceratodon purpureus]
MTVLDETSHLMNILGHGWDPTDGRDGGVRFQGFVSLVLWSLDSMVMAASSPFSSLSIPVSHRDIAVFGSCGVFVRLE